MQRAVVKTQADTLEIARSEYQRLKKLEKSFGRFLLFAEHARDISEAREELKGGEGIRQEELFKELGG